MTSKYTFFPSSVCCFSSYSVFEATKFAILMAKLQKNERKAKDFHLFYAETKDFP